MTYRMNYPETVREVLNRRRKYKPDALRALKAFRRSKPWRGTEEERMAKFRELHLVLCRVYGVRPELTLCRGGFACYIPGLNRINLPKLSVVTYLHEFSHARGADERRACGWSINLFRRIFPRSYSRCRHRGHVLVNDNRRPQLGE